MEKAIGESTVNIPSSDPFRALEEVIYLLDSARSQEGVKPARRYQSIEKIDIAAQPHVRRLTTEYGKASERVPRVQERRIWNAAVEYWRHLGAAYEDCFWQYQAGERGAAGLKDILPVIISRAIRALGAELKWSMMSYSAVDPTLWGRIGALYVVAEQAALAQEPCLIYRHRGIESSIHNEYLRVLMVAMAAVDTLTPRQIELADQLTASFVTSFPMQVQPGKGCHYYVDLSAARPPARLVDRLQSPAPNPRFYGPGPAGAQAEKLIQVIQSRQKIPEDLDLDGDCDPQSVIDVLRHLARQWASIPPARGEEREESSARLHIVHDFDTVLQAAQSVGRNPDLEREMETWTTLNASDSGFGAVLPEAPQEWLRVGTLIAARIEGTVSWGVGVIRRLTMNPNRQRFVGIQMVSRGATTVQLHPADTPADPNSDGEVALLLPSSGQESAGKGELNLLLKTGSFYSHRAVLMEFHQRGYHLMPKQVVDAGRDFEIVRFRVLQR